MTFTDDDLKRLKKQLDSINREACSPGDIVSFACLNTLIARLEAAEALISDCPQYEPEFEEKRQAWRKSAGKD